MGTEPDGKNAIQNSRVRSYSHRAMDTEFRIMFGEDEDETMCASAATAAFARIDSIETIFSRFIDTSDVAVIKALVPGQTAVVAPETMAVLVTSAKVCAATNGAFDPVVGAIMDILRKKNGGWDTLDDEARNEVLARGGMRRLILDVDGLRIAVKPDSLGRNTPVELDFGGIGKGFAVDECRKLIAGDQFEIRSFLVDAGTSTQWAQGDGWRVGVGGRWKKRTRLDVTLALDNAAISGSGKEIQGEHVIDVRHGRAAARWEHAWVLCESAAVADALSTAALSLSHGELAAAGETLEARILVARRQSPLLDRFRDPLSWHP